MDPHWISSEIAKEEMRLKTVASRYRGEEKKTLKIPGFNSHLDPQEQSTLLELDNVKLNCNYLISSIWPKLKQELVEKYIKLGTVLFHII
jgi:hypothetical protein